MHILILMFLGPIELVHRIVLVSVFVTLLSDFVSTDIFNERAARKNLLLGTLPTLAQLQNQITIGSEL